MWSDRRRRIGRGEAGSGEFLRLITHCHNGVCALSGPLLLLAFSVPHTLSLKGNFLHCGHCDTHLIAWNPRGEYNFILPLNHHPLFTTSQSDADGWTMCRECPRQGFPPREYYVALLCYISEAHVKASPVICHGKKFVLKVVLISGSLVW